MNQNDKNASEIWKVLKEVFKKSTEKSVRYKLTKMVKKPWITAKIMGIIKKRKKFNSVWTNKLKQN